MSISITLYDKNAWEIMDIVHQLRSSGLVQGQDFDFLYTPGSWSLEDGTITKSATFVFYAEKHATLFSLKYS